MKKLVITIFLIFAVTQLNLAQSNNTNKLSKTFVLSLGYGVTAASTDFQTIKLGSQFTGAMEYNFNSTSKTTFGFRVFGARGEYGGKSEGLAIPEFRSPFYYIGAGPQVTFEFSKSLSTTFLLGGSYLQFYPKDLSDNNLPNFAAKTYDNSGLAGNVEMSVRYLTSDNISLNFNLGAFASTSTNNDFLDDISKNGNGIDIVYSAGVSLSYYFRGAKDTDMDGVVDSKDMCPNTPRGVRVDDFGCPLDSDGDGVADYMDKCPDTPKGVKVDKNGCPLDTDGDGVADYLDKCPGTPTGVKVDSDGCPLDSDGDGVPDYKDKCPDTPRGDKVDEYGCSVIAPIEFGADANFNLNSYKLLTASHEKLDKLAEKMINNPQYKASVEGYTDKYGKADYNLWLSKKRAESVINYLVKKGVDRDRFTVKPFGETNPVASNDTKEGRARNRRVVVRLTQ